MKIGIVGAGYVGLVTAAVVGSAGHTLVVCETDPRRRDALVRRAVPVAEPGLQALWDNLAPYEVVEHGRELAGCDAVVVCVQTPERPDGGIDRTHVERALGQFTTATGPVVIRSTVPPGTCAALQRAFPHLTLAHVPEFLVEGRAVHDALHPARVVLGTDHDALRPLLRQLFVATCAVDVRHFEVDLTTAELAKVGANVALASRVALINALARQALHHGIDPRVLRDLLGSDPRIGADYLQPSLGFGGSCLPKDVAGLLHSSQQADLPSPFLAGLQADNRAHLDWIVGWIRNHAPPAPRVAVWGLSFKAGVADTRGSRVQPLLEGLLAIGATVRTFDPRAPLPAAWAQTGLAHCTSSLQAVEDADVLVVATAEPEWAEPPLTALAERMRGRWIVDGSFNWNPTALREAGWVPLGGRQP